MANFKIGKGFIGMDVGWIFVVLFFSVPLPDIVIRKLEIISSNGITGSDGRIKLTRSHDHLLI